MAPEAFWRREPVFIVILHKHFVNILDRKRKIWYNLHRYEDFGN